MAPFFYGEKMDAVIKVQVSFNGESEKVLMVKNASGSIPPSQHSPDYVIDVIASRLSSLGIVSKSVPTEVKPPEKVAPTKKVAKKKA